MKQINSCPFLNKTPRRLTIMIFALNSTIECLHRLLNFYRLATIRIVKHYSNRSVLSINNRLNPRVFLGDMIPVSCCVPPLDFNGIIIEEAVNLESLWPFAQSILNSSRARVRIGFQETQLCSSLQKCPRILVKKSALVLIFIDQASFNIANSQHLIN